MKAIVASEQTMGYHDTTNCDSAGNPRGGCLLYSGCLGFPSYAQSRCGRVISPHRVQYGQ
jgi:hypothetical protein